VEVFICTYVHNPHQFIFKNIYFILFGMPFV
jgi:hypothetical protein